MSWSSPARVQIYFFKTLIPVAGFLVLLQGIAEAVRCVMCLRSGEWPARLHDVEETETMALHQHEDEERLRREEEEKIKMHEELKKLHQSDEKDRGEDK